MNITDFTMEISSVYFDEIIKTVDKIDAEYVSLEKNIGYWITSPIFLDDCFEKYLKYIQSQPIWRMNNEEIFEGTNPFATIHLPDFSTGKILKLVSDFYVLSGGRDKNIGVTDWGNLYFKDHSKPINRWRLPHMDYNSGLAANLWLSEHTEVETGTKLYFYTGKTYQNNWLGRNYDFQMDSNHRLYNEWHSMGPRDRKSRWINFTDEEALYWGFEPVGMAPTKYKCMTMYDPSVSHTPFIHETVEFRWSHTFCCFGKNILL